MNMEFIRKISIVLLVALSINTKANVKEVLIKEQPHAIYHVLKNKTLMEAANLIANRSNIVFKINADLENDVITQKLAADDWQMALSQLLNGYNYTIESADSAVKKVIVTSRHGNTQIKEKPDESELIVVEPRVTDTLPQKYKAFAAGSVFKIKLPMDQLHRVPLGGEVTLDLPIGQIQIKHDNLVDHGNENSTWIGYLNEEGKGYRFYLSQGETGIIGNIYTPDGAYNIETIDGETVLVDIEQSGLESAGYEHDEAEVPGETIDLVDNNFQLDDNISRLERTAEKARSKADTLAAQAKELYLKYLQTIKVNQDAQTRVNLIRPIIDDTINKLTLAKASLKISRKNDELKNSVRTLKATYNTQKSQLKAAEKLFKSTSKAMRSLRNAYDKKLAQANAAEVKAQNAEAIYAASQANTTTKIADSSPTTNTVVDLMVLYTSFNQTASYAKQRIQYLVDVSNQAYKDSGINMSLRLVHTRQTSYSESNANSQALDDLATSKGAFANVSTLRNEYGADLIALFRPLYAQTTGSCGTTYVGFANGSNADPKLGFTTISDGYSKDSKSNYYCETSTFTHEIGHNFGNVHDREYSDFPGKFDYSYAWGINGKFGTIMSYHGPTVMLFASPKLETQCAGTACGFAEGTVNASDQTRTINYTAPMVSRYRSTRITTPVIQ